MKLNFIKQSGCPERTQFTKQHANSSSRQQDYYYYQLASFTDIGSGSYAIANNLGMQNLGANGQRTASMH